MEVSETFRLWAEEVGKLMGMDIYTVDAIHTSDGKDHILVRSFFGNCDNKLL